MEGDDSKEKLLRYIEYSIEDLRVARDSLEERISVLQGDHWIVRWQGKTSIDIRRNLSRIVFVLLGVLTVLVILALINSFHISVEGVSGSKDKLEMFPEIVYYIMAVGFLVGIIVTLMGDGTYELRRDLARIELVLSKRLIHSTKKEVIFDTNVYDNVLDGKLDMAIFEDAKKRGFIFYSTHVQIDELNKIEDTERRGALTLILTTLAPEITPTESMVVGVSRVGYAKVGSGNLLERLRAGAESAKSATDALIGEVAIKKGLILVSNDTRFRSRVIREGGIALSVDEFLIHIAHN